MTLAEFDSTKNLNDSHFKDNSLIGSTLFCYDARIWDKRGRKDRPKEEGGNIDCFQLAEILSIERDYVCCKTQDDPGIS